MSRQGEEALERCPLPGCGSKCAWFPAIIESVHCCSCTYRGPEEDMEHPGAKHNTFCKGIESDRRELELLRELADATRTHLYQRKIEEGLKSFSDIERVMSAMSDGLQVPGTLILRHTGNSGALEEGEGGRG